MFPVAHIEASSVSMALSLTDRNTSNSDINVFRDAYWFVADV